MKFGIKRMDAPVYIALVGAVLSAIAAFVASRNQAKESEENSKLYKQLKEQSDTIAAYAIKNEVKAEENTKLYKQLKDQGDTITLYAINNAKKVEENNELYKQLADKTDQIARINHELADTQKQLGDLSVKSLNYLTGGDSWCFVELFGEENGKINVHLQHRGEYPLSALRILIANTSAARRDYGEDNLGLLKWAMYSEKYTTIIPIGPLPKPVGLNSVTYPVMSAITYGSVPFDPNVNEHYSILFMAQNGSWTQEYSFTYDEHKSRRVSYVIKRDNIILLSRSQ